MEYSYKEPGWVMPNKKLSMYNCCFDSFGQNMYLHIVFYSFGTTEFNNLVKYELSDTGFAWVVLDKKLSSTWNCVVTVLVKICSAFVCSF